MKKLLMVAILGVSLGGVTGCRIGECWTEAWNSRFHPEKNAAQCTSAPCVMVDECPCQDGGTVVTAPTSGGCGCGR